MRIPKLEADARIAGLKKALDNAGIKMTIQRLEVFREIVQSGTHPDADSIYRAVKRRVPTVSLDTVYRTLWLLLDLGLISSLGPRDKVRFDGNTDPHHHFVCKKCGATLDFCSEDFDKLPLPDVVRELGQVESRRVELEGVCSRCVRGKDALRR